MKSQTFPMSIPIKICSLCAGNLWIIFPSVAGSGWPPDSSSAKQMQYLIVGIPCLLDSPLEMMIQETVVRVIWWRESDALLAERWIYWLTHALLLWECCWKIMEQWLKMQAYYIQTMTPSTSICPNLMQWWRASTLSFNGNPKCSTWKLTSCACHWLKNSLSRKAKMWMKAVADTSYPIYQPLRWGGGYDTRSVFKRSLTGLNSEFSFS